MKAKNGCHFFGWRKTVRMGWLNHKNYKWRTQMWRGEIYFEICWKTALLKPICTDPLRNHFLEYFRCKFCKWKMIAVKYCDLFVQFLWCQTAHLVKHCIIKRLISVSESLGYMFMAIWQRVILLIPKHSPSYNNDEIENVPYTPEVGAIIEDKPQCGNFEHSLNAENSEKIFFSLFL